MIWIGFYRANENWIREVEATMRRTGKTRQEVLAETGILSKVRAFPQSLPQSCRLVGAYNPTRSISHGDPAWAQFPAVVILETDDPADVTHYINYYDGILTVAFHPYIEVPRT